MQERIYFDLSNLYQNLYQLDESYDVIEEDSDYFVLEYLIDEGYADNIECAGVILERMSDEWYNLIVEGLPKSATMSRSEMNSRITELTKKQKALTSKFDSKNPDPSVVKQLQSIVAEIKRLRSGASELRQISGDTAPERIAKKRKESKTAPLTAQDRADLRSTRSVEPQGSQEERSARREAIRSRKPSGSGQTPQSTKMNVAPVTTQTREQRRREQLANVAAGGRAGGSSQATTYVDRSTGERRQLNVLGGTETNYGGRGRSRVAARYGQGSQGTGERGPTPAGSTVDPSKPRTRGTGRRPQG